MIRVNQKELEEDKILQEMQYHQAGSQREAMIKASEALVVEELLIQRADELGLDRDGMSEDELTEALLARDVKMPEATEDEIFNYYQGNRERFTTSPLVAARHILISADPIDDTARMEAEETANQVLKELQDNRESFESLVSRFSDCPSKETGGELGQLSRGQTVPEFERQLFTCAPGLVERPLASRYGFHVVEIQQKVEGLPLAFEQVRHRIRDYLNEKVRRKAIAQYVQHLINEADIEGFDFEQSSSPLMQ